MIGRFVCPIYEEVFKVYSVIRKTKSTGMKSRGFMKLIVKIVIKKIHKKCQFPLGNLVITEVLPTKSLGGHSQLGPKKIVNAL
jgi:hypothetical protein